MSYDEPEYDERPTRSRASSSNPRTATPMAAVIIAAVAGLLGLLILRNVKNDGAGSSSPRTTTTVPPLTDATTTIPPTTLPPIVRTGATVVVANASGTKGAAGNLTTLLKGRGYTTGKAITATGGTQLAVTQVLARAGDTAAQAVAQSIMTEMGLTGTPGVLDASAPVKATQVATAGVLVLLGTDKAGQDLLPVATTTAPADTVAAITPTSATN
jgi:hypothetical protein